jgi:hypothetical protein
MIFTMFEERGQMASNDERELSALKSSLREECLQLQASIKEVSVQ